MATIVKVDKSFISTYLEQADEEFKIHLANALAIEMASKYLKGYLDENVLEKHYLNIKNRIEEIVISEIGNVKRHYPSIGTRFEPSPTFAKQFENLVNVACEDMISSVNQKMAENSDQIINGILEQYEALISEKTDTVDKIIEAKVEKVLEEKLKKLVE